MQHQKQWNFLKNKYETGQLAHAYLFLGEEGIGKKSFALDFLKFINCKFPDFLVLSEEEIKISQIREVQNFLAYKSYHGGYKAVVVDGAEKMNQEAQSCFLKTLEEPKGSTLAILIASKPEMVLPTIYSRCQPVKFFGRPEYSLEHTEREAAALKQILAAAGAGFGEKFKFAKSFEQEGGNLQEALKALLKHYRKLLLEGLGKTPDSQKIKNNIKLIEDINNKINFSNASHKLALEILLMEL